MVTRWSQVRESQDSTMQSACAKSKKSPQSWSIAVGRQHNGLRPSTNRPTTSPPHIAPVSTQKVPLAVNTPSLRAASSFAISAYVKLRWIFLEAGLMPTFSSCLQTTLPKRGATAPFKN